MVEAVAGWLSAFDVSVQLWFLNEIKIEKNHDFSFKFLNIIWLDLIHSYLTRCCMNLQMNLFLRWKVYTKVEVRVHEAWEPSSRTTRPPPCVTTLCNNPVSAASVSAIRGTTSASVTTSPATGTIATSVWAVITASLFEAASSATLSGTSRVTTVASVRPPTKPVSHPLATD